MNPARSVLPLVLAVALGISGVTTVEAAPPNDDEVALTNGGFVRGEIVESVPDSHVVIVTRTGETRRYEWSEVAGIKRGGGDAGTSGASPSETSPSETSPTGEGEGEGDAEAPPEGPSPLSPQVHIEVEGVSGTVTLNRVTRRSSYPNSAKIGSDTVWESVCAAPCDRQIEEPDGEFFLAVNMKPRTRGFRLPGDASGYQINYEQIRRPALLWSGVALLPTAVIGALVLAIIPARHNMRQSAAGAMWASAGVLTALGIGGGVTLIAFGNKRSIEILPLDQNR